MDVRLPASVLSHEGVPIEVKPYMPVRADGTVIDPAGGGDPASETTLAAVQASVDALGAKLDSLKTYTDGLEALVGTSNTNLTALHTDLTTTLAAYVDGLEALIGTSNTNLGTLHTDLATTLAAFLDGLEGLITSSNTKLDTVHTDLATTLGAFLDGLEGLLGTVNTSIGATNTALGTTNAALAGNLSVIPKLTSGGTIALQTNATGATFNTFGSQACKQLTVVNDTGTKLEFKFASETVYLPLPDGQAYTFYGIANANEVNMRRADTSNTQVTAKARWEA